MLIERLANLEKDRKGNGKELDPNQKRLRNRLATPILSTAITHELWKNISELSHFVPRTTMPTESWLSVWNVLRTRVRGNRGDLSVDGAHLNSSRFQRSVL